MKACIYLGRAAALLSGMLMGIAVASDGAASSDAEHAVVPARPNIVLIMADDLGWNDVGYHGSDIRTPAIDRLAEEGARLNRFYTYPACTQTRGALMSGRRMRSVGLLEPMPPWSDAGLPLHIETLADRLQGAGYRTWKLGKWHLGDHYLAQFPNQRGFDHFYGFLSGEVNYDTHVFASALDWQRNGVTLEEPGYTTHLLTREALRLIEAHPVGEPFFLDLSYNAPHTPLQAPPGGVEDYAHITDPKRRRFAAMVSEMDRGIAEVVAALRARDDAHRTLIVFLSDNGAMGRFGGDNSPLRGGKTQHYEGGLRVPAIAVWPEVIAPGLRDQFIGVHDLYPTFLALAGLSPADDTALPGISVWPAIADNAAFERRAPMVFALMMPGRPPNPAIYSSSVIQGDWKLIEVSSYRRRLPDGQRYELIRRELFNIADDPQEQEELSAREPTRTQALAAILAAVPKGEPIGFSPPPPDWSLPIMPGVEPDPSPPTRPPLVEAARARATPARN